MADKKQAKVWTPNDTQNRFLEILKANKERFPDGMTLREIKKVEGVEFKTGSINTLASHGLVRTDGPKREFKADIVYDGEVIGSKSYADTVYAIVE